MFPLNLDMPVIKKDGTRTTLGDITGDISEVIDDIETLGEGLDALDERLDTAEDDITALEGDLSGAYLSLGTKNVILATADGTKTLSTLMTEALTALQGIIPSAQIEGATHMKVLGVLMPYADAGATRTVIFSEGGLTPLASYSETTRYLFYRVALTGTGDGVTLWMAEFASTNRWLMQTIATQAVSDFTSRKPSNGTNIECTLEFYKKID